MGSATASFPTTRASFVARMGSSAAEERARALDTLARSYWKPVYKYLRLRFKKGGEEAQDLTQDFFAHALEKGWLERFDASRGGFRGFLRLSLDGFVTNAGKAGQREKRGGGASVLRLDFAAAEGELPGLEPPAPESVEIWFEREWRRELLAGTLAELERVLEASGHARRLSLFRRYDLADAAEGTPPTYAELARELGIEVTIVTNELAAARREFRRLLLDRLRDETSDEAEFKAELRALLGTAAP